MNYSQFLNMIPEATLMVVLLITFFADFCSSKSADRKWFNPLVCLLWWLTLSSISSQQKPQRHLAACTQQVLLPVS